jgi:heat shock protein HslJ
MRVNAAAATVFMLALAGCLHPPDDMPTAQVAAYGGSAAGGASDARLRGEWTVEDVDGGGVIDNARGTIIFGPDGRVSGRAFCNSYGAAYTLTGDALTIGPTAATKMACAPALMGLEDKFFKALSAVRGYAVTADGALVLRGEGHSIKVRKP